MPKVNEGPKTKVAAPALFDGDVVVPVTPPSGSAGNN